LQPSIYSKKHAASLR